jgi:hypothetical protein
VAFVEGDMDEPIPDHRTGQVIVVIVVVVVVVVVVVQQPTVAARQSL